MHGAVATVELLLESKCDANAVTAHQLNALHGLQQTANGAACIEALLRAGTDVHGRDWREATPLHAAAGHPLPDATVALLAAGADVTATNRDGGSRQNGGGIGVQVGSLFVWRGGMSLGSKSCPSLFSVRTHRG